jgi:hypothetical protein
MWLILLLSACGVSYEDGLVQEGELNCQLADACGRIDALGGSLDACLESADGQHFDEANCPDYDPAQMRDCLKAWQEAVDAADCEADFEDVCRVCG